MDPLQDLKNKLGIGLGDIGSAVSTGIHDVGNAVSTGVSDVGHALGVSAPSVGNINIAKPSTPNGPSLNVSNPATPNINVTNSPAPSSLTLAGQNQSLRPANANVTGANANNPVNIKNYNVPPPGNTGIKPGNQLAQVAQAKTQGGAGLFSQPLAKVAQLKQPMPVAPSTPTTPQSFVGDVAKVGNFGLNTAKAAVAPAEYLGKVSVVNPVRASIALATGGQQASNQVNAQQQQLLQPRQFASNMAQVGLGLATPGVGNLVEKGAAALLPEAFQPLASTVSRVLAGGILGGPYNVASQVGSKQKLTPGSVTSAYAQGSGYGLLFGAGGEALSAGVGGLLRVGKTLLSTAGEPAISAAEQASGLSRGNLINDNEAGTLRDYADYKTGGYSPDINTVNELQMQARNAAKTAGIDVTTGSPQDVTNRIYNYLSERTNFITAHNQVAQGGYIGGQSALGFDGANLTGATFPGADTLPRFEGDDSRATVQLPTSNSTTLGQVLNHPTLYSDYPELQDTRVAVITPKNDKLYGGYNKNNNTVYVNKAILNNPLLLKTTLLHETQHVIQNIEGFEGGTTSKLSGGAAYRQNAGEKEAFTVGSRANMTPQERAANPIQIAQPKPQPRLISDFVSKLAAHEGTDDTYGYKSSEDFVKDYADMLHGIEKNATGGQMQADGEGGYTRTSEHSNFYRQYYAENNRAPSNAAYLQEAEQQLATGHGAYGSSSTYQLLKARESPAAGTPFDTPQIIAARELAKSIPNTMDINSPERVALRQELADKNYGSGALNKNKRLDLVIGPPAAGKSSNLVGPLADKYGSIVLDSDAVKKQLPEFNRGVGSAATHDESAYISDHLMSKKAMSAGDNIVAARLGKNASTMREYMDLAKAKGYEVHLHDMTLPAEKAAARSAARFSETGQFVDPHYILNNVGDKTDFVYNNIKKEAKTYGQYNADIPRGETPELIDASPGYEQPLRQGRAIDTSSNQVNEGQPNAPGTVQVRETPSSAQDLKVADATNPNPAAALSSKISNQGALYDPRSALTQRGESGEPGVPIASGRNSLSDEELQSLARKAPIPTMREIQAIRGENVTPHPTTAEERLQESDAEAYDLLDRGGKRNEAIANYVEHHDMTRDQAVHRVNYVQREINLKRSSENPMVSKISIQKAAPSDIKTPVMNTRDIHNTIIPKLQKINGLGAALDAHDVKLLDLHSKDPEEIAKTAHDPEQFKKVAEAFKDLNDTTHAYGYKLGQPIPYRKQYGSRLIFDLEDPESRENFMKVATPTDKGYTLPRTIKDYDEAAKYGIKRKNANALEDINQDAMERISDLKKLSLQQSLEDAYPGKVAVGQIGRDAETGKIYKELSIPNGAHLSMPSDIADHVNERSRIEAAPDLGVRAGHVKGAVARSTGIADDAKSLFNRVNERQAELSEHDQRLLYKYDHGANPDDLVKEAKNPEEFKKSLSAVQQALETVRSSRDMVTGLTSLRPQNELPHYFQATPEQMDKLGIAQRDRLEDYPGFQDTNGNYRSYLQAYAKDQLKPLFHNPFEAVNYYGGKAVGGLRNQALFTTLAHAAPDDIAERGVRTTDEENKPFSQAAGRLPFDVSKKLDNQLGGLRSAWEPKTAAGRGVEGSIRLAGKVTKASLWLGSFFHYSNLAKNIAGLDLISGHPNIAGKGLGSALEATASKAGYEDLIDHYRETGTLQAARDMGIVLSDGSKALSRYEDGNVLALVDAAKKNGVDPRSPEGTDLGRIYNAVLGRRNSAVEASNPTIEKFLNYTALAPHYMTTQLRLMADALLPKKLGGAGYDTPISLYTAGGAARGTVLGARLFEAATAVTLGIILTHKFPNPRQLAQEAGLYPNNPVPNASMSSKNSKGESQVMNLPTDQLGLLFGLITDPKHFIQSRFSPIGTFGTSLVTNENWNGQPLTQPGQPNALGTRIVKGAENAFVPIGIQNFTNLQHSPNNPDILQGIAQEFGGRLKTNPNDPQVKANAAYFNANSTMSNLLAAGKFSQINPGLKDVPWQQAQQFLTTFNSLHPKNTTDATGAKYPQQYNASSSEVKYNAYTMTDPVTGKRALSPVFYADQKLENATSGYPSSPLYKLSGTGTDVDGSKAPQALVAMEYQHEQDPAAKTDILNANGGQNGWLAQYENKLGTYSQNYQSNMTDYFKQLGWTQNAIDSYWKNHPSTPDPVTQVTFPQSTTNLINKYYAYTASGDSTSAAKFFTQNAAILGPAFDQTAQHANALRSASGELQLQGYPSESAHVTSILNSMPSGSDSASKKTRALLIQNNPDVSQYLANIALYESLDRGAQFRYQNPTNMAATEGQNINAAGQAGQTFLKDTSSLGNYDIGENKTTGQYSFMQGGGFPAGTTAVGSTGSGSSNPLIAMPPYPKKPPRHSGGKLKIRRLKVRNIKVHQNPIKPISISHSGPLHASNVIHMAK